MGLTKSAQTRVEKEIEELIDRYAKQYDDRGYMHALELMVDHAQTALDARKEEIGDEDENDEDDD